MESPLPSRRWVPGRRPAEITTGSFGVPPTWPRKPVPEGAPDPLIPTDSGSWNYLRVSPGEKKIGELSWSF